MPTYSVIRETWLSRKLDPTSPAIAALATLVLLFASLVYWGDVWGAEQWMTATQASVFGAHQWWLAWSTLLVHADAKHFLSNALLFFILGTFLHSYFGAMAFPILSFLMGGLTNLMVLRQMPEATQLIGASGIVFWMGGFWLVLYFAIDRRRSWGQRALRAGGVGLALFMPAEAFDPGVSYASHFYGFISGMICAAAYYLAVRRKIMAAEVREVVEEASEP